MRQTNQADEYDSPWKTLLPPLLPFFLALLFPMVYNDIDWSRPPEFLDKELQKILRGAQVGRTTVDKLVKVWLKDGTELWLLLHIEIQSQYEAILPRRVCRYQVRIWDVYDHPVVSLVVLADDRPRWKPNRFQFGRWGVGNTTTFLVAKLLDWRNRWEELEQSTNPVAVAVMAHLKTMETRLSPEERAEWRFRFVRRLYEGGFAREHVVEMLRFLDWIMTLPEELEERYNERVEEYEKERNVEYVTSWERNGIKKGIKQGLLQMAREAVLDVLDARFGAVDSSITQAVAGINDLETLKRLRRRAATINLPDKLLEEPAIHSS